MTAIYHITHVDNLGGILAAGGLHCDRVVAERAVPATSMAHSHIKVRRGRTAVPTCHGGTLADYVPFYFGPRSPMLYTIHRGRVEGYRGGQDPVLHLVSSAERIAQGGLPYTFTDGHAVMVLSQFYDDLADLEAVDLALMGSRYWYDTDDDPDRKRRRQAEFLVHDFLPWSFVERVGVRNGSMREQVEQALGGAPAPEVDVQTQWYY